MRFALLFLTWVGSTMGLNPANQPTIAEGPKYSKESITGVSEFVTLVAESLKGCKAVSDAEGSTLFSQINKAWTKAKPGIRYIARKLANQLATAVYDGNVDFGVSQVRARAFLRSLPIETLKFSWILQKNVDYVFETDACTAKDGDRFSEKKRNHLTRLVGFMYAVASKCGENEEKLWQRGDEETVIKKADISTDFPDGNYRGDPEKVDSDVDTSPKDAGVSGSATVIEPKEKVDVESSVPAAISHTDAASDIASILTNESNMAAKLSAVAIAMSALSRTSVQAAAQIQILNTYIDLVQRAMIQLTEIDNQMDIVTKAQAAVFQKIKDATGS